MPSSAAAAAPAAINSLVDTALALRSQGRLKEALEVLSSPGDFSVDVYSLRGELQLELGLVQETVGSFSTVLAFEPDNVHALQHVGLCLRRLRRWASAAEAYRKLLALETHRDDDRIALGECLLHLNRLEEALACFDACWSETSRRRALFGKAVALQLLRRFEEAERIYERLLALDPKAEEVLSNLIALGVEIGDTVRVHRYSLRLLEIRPHSTTALQGLTLVALERDENGNAGRYYDLLSCQRSDGATGACSEAGHVVEYRPKPYPAGRMAG